ncbi:hypothetical protein [Aestuariivivens sediminis]|uniref:hypothetical protein n=1 Tax=Aestuariivivens sediminis TaxID=2913557 RepID=UPI001F59EFDB|nr:hypothetical protein [Aestuariivivens sediminis]
MEFIISILTVYGMSAIVTQGKIFEPLRDFTEKHSPNFWKYLTSCMQCLPFWVGILVSLLTQEPIMVNQEHLPNFINILFTYLFSGALYSGTTMFIHTVFVHLKGDK